MTASTRPNLPSATTRREASADRRLLVAGSIAGPLFVAMSVGQALTRDGFDMRRHAASLLLNGNLGWLQTLVFLSCGILLGAGAIGLRRTATRPATRRIATLVGVYGISFVGAGVCKADPSLGFPVGTPNRVGDVSAAGVGHMIFGMIGFFAVTAACVIAARDHRRQGRSRWALASAVTAALFLAAIIGISSGSGSANAAVTLGFWFAVTVSFGWLSATLLSRPPTAAHR